MGDAKKVLFGRYELGRLLGQGTFAKVYHGKHLMSGESVAIKVLNKEQVQREGLMEQIVREISVMRLVRHPNVVELREVMATKSRIFFVMEHVRGGELFARVLRGRLREDDARRFFQQLISAIEFCHSRGVSHRDLKPENLLLDERGNLKVSDFGLSALPEQLRNDGLLHTQCGTPAYIAPEVLRKKGYDGAKSDLWSCGVILYVLLAGSLPFHDENLMGMYHKIYRAEYKFPTWFSTGTKRLVSKLLLTKPEKRIGIPDIMKDSWFKKGFSRSITTTTAIPTPPPLVVEEEGEVAVGKEVDRAPFCNAFELISAMSSGFDLSGMFESKRKAGTVFTSTRSVVEVTERLLVVGREMGLEVARSRGFKVRMEGKKGRLVVAADVLDVADGFTLVEFWNLVHDEFEYATFCEEVRPGLGDLVWSWSGEPVDS